MENFKKEDRRDKGVWSDRQGVVSFLVLMLLCSSFFTLGLYIGRSSNVSSASITPTNSTISNNITDKSQPAALTKSNEAATPNNSDPKTNIDNDAPLTTASDKFAIQVATANTQIEADQIIEKLRRAGFESVHVITPEPNSVAQFYAVRVGPYDIETARQVATELQQEHGFKNVQVMPKFEQ